MVAVELEAELDELVLVVEEAALASAVVALAIAEDSAGVAPELIAAAIADP